MANLIYSNAKARLLGGDSLLLSNTLKVALVDSGYTPNSAHTSFDSDAGSYEISGTNYAAGGVTVTNKSVALDGTTAKFDGDDAVWSNATFTGARWALLYHAAAGDNFLLCAYDLGGDKQVTNGTFTVQWSSTGILRNG